MNIIDRFIIVQWSAGKTFVQTFMGLDALDGYGTPQWQRPSARQHMGPPEVLCKGFKAAAEYLYTVTLMKCPENEWNGIHTVSHGKLFPAIKIKRANILWCSEP